MNTSDSITEVVARTRGQGLKVLDDPDVARVLFAYFGGSCAEIAAHLSTADRQIWRQSVHERRRRLEQKYGVTITPLGGKGNATGRAAATASEEPLPERPEESSADLLRGINALQRELAKERARTKIIVEALRECITVLPPLKVPKFTCKSRSREQIVVSLLSDGHIGAFADPGSSANMTNYNFDVFRERLWKLRDGIFSIVEKERRSAPIRTLYIDYLGDMLEGERMFPSQPHQIDLPLLGQFVRGARELAAYIREMAGFFEKVVVHAVPGNHPEGKKAQDESHPVSRAETVFLLLIEAMLQNQKNVEFYISPSRFLLYKVFGHYTLMMHGNELRGGFASIPFYGLDRLTHRMVQLCNIPLSVIELGHHHVSASINVMFVKAMMNGSMVGPSQYSIAKLQTGTYPYQLVYGVHPERPFTWQYEIQLGDRPDLKFAGDGVGTPWISGKEDRGSF